MASVIRSLGITGISGYPLMVEVAIIAGLQTTNIVGLGDSAIKEAKDRMEACKMGWKHLIVPLDFWPVFAQPLGHP